MRSRRSSGSVVGRFRIVVAFVPVAIMAAPLGCQHHKASIESTGQQRVIHVFVELRDSARILLRGIDGSVLWEGIARNGCVDVTIPDEMYQTVERIEATAGVEKEGYGIGVINEFHQMSGTYSWYILRFPHYLPDPSARTNETRDDSRLSILAVAPSVIGPSGKVGHGCLALVTLRAHDGSTIWTGPTKEDGTVSVALDEGMIERLDRVEATMGWSEHDYWLGGITEFEPAMRDVLVTIPQFAVPSCGVGTYNEDGILVLE